MATNNKSSGVLIDKDQLKQKWALQFPIACVLLAALIFGLINALMYFSDRARAQLAAPFAKTLGLECLLHTPRALKRVKVPGPYVHTICYTASSQLVAHSVRAGCLSSESGFGAQRTNSTAGRPRGAGRDWACEGGATPARAIPRETHGRQVDRRTLLLTVDLGAFLFLDRRRWAREGRPIASSRRNTRGRFITGNNARPSQALAQKAW